MPSSDNIIIIATLILNSGNITIPRRSATLILNSRNITITRRSGNSRAVLETRAITLTDADTYYCSGTYGNEQVFEESVNVTVRGNFCIYCIKFYLHIFEHASRLLREGLLYSGKLWQAFKFDKTVIRMHWRILNLAIVSASA